MKRPDLAGDPKMKTSRCWEEDRAEDELRKKTERVTRFGCAIGLDTALMPATVEGVEVKPKRWHGRRSNKGGREGKWWNERIFIFYLIPYQQIRVKL